MTCGGLEKACCFSSVACSKVSPHCFGLQHIKHVLSSLLEEWKKPHCSLKDISHDFHSMNFQPVFWTWKRSIIGLLSSHWQVTSLLKNLQSTALPPPSSTHCLEIKIQASKRRFQDLMRLGLCLPLSGSAKLNLLLFSSSNTSSYFSLLNLCSSCSHIWNGLFYLDKSY